ncbi:hypothetical protein GQ43DRAFT_465140 [Delitschia confertaspora ATCC 74209]|uniref:Uncharacterized protein n=1 Tax=Delitschia confertaspora ATCC 74209 TaxID=1513339 RepID=A0A9P4JKW6_9PLEO|nr:hypothetical protein GQ43DRAFT_465140 [Delitschia confertaspora ATCC 74209]
MMSTSKSQVDPANVVEALVYSLLEAFDATRDLYKTLRIKEKRDHEELKRLKGYPESPISDHLDDDAAAGNASIVLDKAAVKHEFSNGFDSLGPPFAVGDVASKILSAHFQIVITQTALQAEIIRLQSILITIFLYGPTSRDPISSQLSTLLDASRAAGTSTVDALAAQRQRMLTALPPSLRPIATPSAPYPVTIPPRSSIGSGDSMRSKPADWPVSPTSQTPSVHTLVFSRPKASRTDTESTSFTGLTTSEPKSLPQPLYCRYALDLQRHPNQPLSSTITSNSSPYCPDCHRGLHLSPGKAWEIFKDTEDGERVFRIQNRFVVKCHRVGEQGYSCVMCHLSSDIDTVCGDVKALVRHIWIDHSVAELKSEEDIVEVIEKIVPRGRSRSDGDVGKGVYERGYEREYDGMDIRR